MTLEFVCHIPKHAELISLKQTNFLPNWIGVRAVFTYSCTLLTYFLWPYNWTFMCQIDFRKWQTNWHWGWGLTWKAQNWEGVGQAQIVFQHHALELLNLFSVMKACFICFCAAFHRNFCSVGYRNFCEKQRKSRWNKLICVELVLIIENIKYPFWK